MAEGGGLNDGGLGDALAERLLSDGEFADRFETLLLEPPYADFAFRFTVTGADGRGARILESREIPKDGEIRSEVLSGDAHVRVEMKIWRRPGVTKTGVSNVLVEVLHALIRQQWGARDAMTLVPDLRVGGTKERFVAAVQRAAEQDQFAVVFLDLDHFKKVNDEHGHSVGDQVLTEFGGRLRSAFGDVGVILRHGGEEFALVLAGLDAIALVERINNFLSNMRETPFAALGRVNTCSVGVALYSLHTALPEVGDYNALLKDAMAAERRAKAEGRNGLRLSGDCAPTVATTVDRLQLLQAALQVRRLLGGRAGDPSEIFAQACAANLRDRMIASPETPWTEHIAAFQKELGLLIGEMAPTAGRPAWQLGVLAPLEWAEIVAAGALGARGAPDDDVRFLVDGNLRVQLIRGGVVTGQVVVCEVTNGGRLEIDVGRPEYPVGGAPDGSLQRWPLEEVAPEDRNPSSPVLLLPIGDAATDVAERYRKLAADVIHIDDRPATGGGLPDFWQSNLARILRVALGNPNISVVVAIGNPSSASLTLERLTGPQGDDEAQRQLSLSSRALKLFRDRRLQVEVVATDPERILEVMLAATQAAAPHDFARRERVGPDQERRRRRLPMPAPDVSARLKLEDGFRARTLADAYPQAVQLIRSATEEHSHRELSRREFREFASFKLVLTQPLSERVPDYWSADAERLKRYYQENFVDPSGVFGRALHGSLATAPSARGYLLQAAVTAVTHRQPTRRLNMPVVPQSLGEPLGLTGIQLMPRYSGDRARLDAIWIWRTVDALVGLPFSAYGSIAWTDDFLRDLQGRLDEQRSEVTVEMGELTYIALSFHMYLHDGDQEIARAIVQDASR